MGYCDPFDLKNEETTKVNVQWQPFEDPSNENFSPDLVKEMVLDHNGLIA